MLEFPSWVSAGVGAIAAALVMWGAFRERLGRHEQEITALKAEHAAQRARLDTATEKIARLEGLAEKETP